MLARKVWTTSSSPGAGIAGDPARPVPFFDPKAGVSGASRARRFRSRWRASGGARADRRRVVQKRPCGSFGRHPFHQQAPTGSWTARALLPLPVVRVLILLPWRRTSGVRVLRTRHRSGPTPASARAARRGRWRAAVSRTRAGGWRGDRRRLTPRCPGPDRVLAAKLDTSGAGLTPIGSRISLPRGAPDEERRQFHRCLEACDYARFAPGHRSGSEEMRRTLQEAEEIIVRLERSLST